MTREEPLTLHEALADSRNLISELCRREANDHRAMLLGALKPDAQRVIRLRIYEGKTLRETAKLMGREYEAIKKMYARAIVKWKNAWDLQVNNDQLGRHF